MPVSIVIGGQYGSEGKGKVSDFWVDKMHASAVVRVGGPNSGHTVYNDKGEKVAFSQLPVSSIRKDVLSILPAGSYLDLSILKDEIQRCNIAPDKLAIDPNAMIIDPLCREFEKDIHLQESIGSTLSGTGEAVAKRVMRSGDVVRAEHIEFLRPFIADTKMLMRDLLDSHHHIVIEGTQGYGLSNLHASCYPFATSRDTTAAGFLSETGLSPFDVDHIIMVIRAFPIRVAGNSGPLPNEITWEELTKESGSEVKLYEFTTVTHKIRRVARFDPGIVKEAIQVNRPDVIVMNHVDYFDMGNLGSHTLSHHQLDRIFKIQKDIGRDIDYVGNGPNTIIEL